MADGLGPDVAGRAGADAVTDPEQPAGRRRCATVSARRAGSETQRQPPVVVQLADDVPVTRPAAKQVAPR
jgi:hypothetical protein